MNSNNLAVLENTKNTNINIWESRDDLKQIKEIYGKNLSDGEFNTLMQMGRAMCLNPFLKEIWAVKYGNNPAQIFIGRDGYRKSAQRHPLYDYHVADAVYSNDTFDMLNGEVNHKYNMVNRGVLIGAYCVVQRKGSSRPTYVFVELKEYSTQKSLWNQQTGKPATMIKKVAEAQGLRAAFQELFAGTYSEYEQFDQGADVSSNAKSGKGIAGLKAKLNMSNESIESVEAVEFDNETGEVIENLITPEQVSELNRLFDALKISQEKISKMLDSAKASSIDEMSEAFAQKAIDKLMLNLKGEENT